MKRTTAYSREQNLADAALLGEMLSRFNRLPFPTVALVQGPAFGGGVGLVSCCDVAVGVSKSTFTLSEVKLGILPATISPYVIARIGAAQVCVFVSGIVLCTHRSMCEWECVSGIVWCGVGECV